MRDDEDIILAEEYDLTHRAVSLGHEDDVPEHTYSLRVSKYCVHCMHECTSSSWWTMSLKLDIETKEIESSQPYLPAFGRATNPNTFFAFFHL